MLLSCPPPVCLLSLLLLFSKLACVWPRYVPFFGIIILSIPKLHHAIVFLQHTGITFFLRLAM